MNYLKMLKEYTKLYKETQNIALKNLDNSIIKMKKYIIRHQLIVIK